MNKKLDIKLKELERNFGLTRASDMKKLENQTTGIFALDYVLDKGIKLVPGGHKIEFYGNESSGKTTFALYVVKKFQQMDKICLWFVSESFHEDWARKIGVDTSRLLLAYPDSIEDSGEKLISLIPQVDLIVMDSVAAFEPEAEIEKDMSESTRGLAANKYSLMCRKIFKVIPKYQITLIFINQIRIKQNVMYGNPEDTPGGKALKFMYDTRIEFRAGKPIEEGTKENKECIGMEVNLYAKKNKLGKPKRRTIIDFYHDGTIDNKKSLFFAGIKYGVIERSGNTYKFGNINVVGKDAFMKKLTDEDLIKLEEDIWKKING